MVLYVFDVLSSNMHSLFGFDFSSSHSEIPNVD